MTEEYTNWETEFVDAKFVDQRLESYRWIHTMNEIHQRVAEDIPVLTVCDREGDFYEFFSNAADLGENFLIRLERV